ncbi:hypothetical protein OF83DRAFT_1086204 [Amylostereum chailletii]|nr:hypothetical protein OF83DRAFT_1086204 [Amylostereum chailletii]
MVTTGPLPLLKLLKEESCKRDLNRTMLSRYQSMSKLRRCFEVLKYPDGASTLTTREGWLGGGKGCVEEAMLHQENSQPTPVTASSELPKQITYVKQSVSIHAVNNEAFIASEAAVNEISRLLSTKYQEGALRPCTDVDSEALTFSNCYFTPHKHVHGEPVVLFAFGVDDHGIFKERDARINLHLRDNQVKYFSWGVVDEMCTVPFFPDPMVHQAMWSTRSGHAEVLSVTWKRTLANRVLWCLVPSGISAGSVGSLRPDQRHTGGGTGNELLPSASSVARIRPHRVCRGVLDTTETWPRTQGLLGKHVEPVLAKYLAGHHDKICGLFKWIPVQMQARRECRGSLRCPGHRRDMAQDTGTSQQTCRTLSGETPSRAS